MKKESFLFKYYEKNLHTYKAQIVAPCLLSVGTFLVPTLLKYEYFHLWNGIVIGSALIIITIVHGYIVKAVSNNETEKYKEEIKDLKGNLDFSEIDRKRANNNYDLLRHLIGVTNRLVDEKRANISTSTLSPQQRFDKCVTLNLMALNMFYELHSRGVDFRIIFFVPQGNDGSYLKPYLWYNHKHITPKSVGDPSHYPIVYDYNSRERKVCECWRAKRIVIVEDAQKEGIEIQHPGQEVYFKSMLAYPVINPDNNKITGIISIVADQFDFFKRNETEYHRFIFEHFATRINFENSEYLKSSIWRSL